MHKTYRTRANGTPKDFDMQEHPEPPYESEVIGCFVAKLAFEAGWRRGNEPLMINLFQQGPWDQRYGDLIAGCTSFLAIEFKRHSGTHGMSAERGKWDRVGLFTHLLGDPALLDTANRCHFLAGGLPCSPGEVQAEVFLPALFDDQDWLKAHFPKFDRERFTTTDTDGVIDEILDGTSGVRSAEELMEYLNVLSGFRWATSQSGSDGPNLLAVGRHTDGRISVSSYYELEYLLKPRSIVRATLTYEPRRRTRPKP